SAKLCQAANATMVSIHYAEEQNFLVNYLFTKKKAVDNVWLGAKYVGSKLYQWVDHTQLTGFSNWAPGSPKNLSDHCVEMLAGDNVVGEWDDERCEKRNMVVCQRAPPISLRSMAESMIELKHSLQRLASKLAETERALIPIGF